MTMTHTMNVQFFFSNFCVHNQMANYPPAEDTQWGKSTQIFQAFIYFFGAAHFIRD